MSRTWAVVKREFNAATRTRMFVLGTLFGPILIIGLFVIPVLLSSNTNGTRTVVIADASGSGLGDAIATGLLAESRSGEEQPRGSEGEKDENRRDLRMSFNPRVENVPAGQAEAEIQHLESQLTSEAADAYLWIPPAPENGDTVEYVGRDTPGLAELSLVRSAVQSAVQRRRLAEAGIEPRSVAGAMKPVGFQARRAGAEASERPETALFGAYILGFIVYMVVILFGQAVLRGVLEEKRDRIVEVITSSIEPEQLMMGKVLGIGGASLLQVLVWVVFAILAIVYGQDIAARFDATLPTLPTIPISVAVVFLLFFAGGFLIYATLYAAMGAIATTDQEAQQMQFPVMLPLIAAILAEQAVIADPTSAVAVWTSLIPLTSAVVMPARAMLTNVPIVQIVGGLLLQAVGIAVLVWAAAKIYRIGILSAGRRPSFREVVQWLRTS